MADIATPTSKPGNRAPLFELANNIVHAPKGLSGTMNAASQKVAVSSAFRAGENPEQHPHVAVDLKATRLISSPYPELANQLRLEDLETPFRLFAFALTVLRPIREDYATAPYLGSFNWTEVFAVLRSLCKQTGFQWKETGVYVVIFRSKLLAGTDRERLGLLDQKSHEEACASGGLLKYWFGSTDNERRNLATCLWRHREDASLGGGGPWHKQARESARVM